MRKASRLSTFGSENGAKRWSEIVFVTAEGRAGVVVDIVAKEADASAEAEGRHRVQQDAIAGAIIAHDVGHVAAFRRAEFEVTHVDVDAAAVE